MQRGSILILAIVTILILSIMAIAGLTVTSLEMKTTQNFYSSKTSFYKGVEGVELIRKLIIDNPDADNVGGISKTKTDTYEETKRGTFEYITGSLVDFEDGNTVSIQPFSGFYAPPLQGISLDDRIKIEPIIWYVPITVKYISYSGAVTYTEVMAGIYSFIKPE